VPIYEFRCLDCATRFEKLCPVGTGAADVNCPVESGHRVRKLFSSFAVRSQGARPDTGGYPDSGGGSGCSSCATHNCASCH